MRVLLICHKNDGTDGWSRYAQSLEKALGDRDHDVLTLSHTSGLPQPLHCMTRPWTLIRVARLIKQAYREQHPDVIHICTEPYALCSVMLPKAILRRTLLTIHGNYGIRPLEWWMTTYLARAMFQNIAHFITVSTYTKTVVQKALGKRGKHFEKNVTVVSNGIELPEWTGKKQANDRHQLIHVGGVKGPKGVLEALRGCKAYRDRGGAPFDFSIIGTLDESSQYVQKVRSFIEDNDLADTVHLRGHISEPELQDVYHTADALLVPSLTTKNTFEGFGLVYMEAAAHGVPSIGPNTSGATEAIQDGVSGHHVTVDDPDAIAEALRRILDEKSICPERCRAWAEDHSIECTAKKTTEVYRLVHSGAS